MVLNEWFGSLVWGCFVHWLLCGLCEKDKDPLFLDHDRGESTFYYSQENEGSLRNSIADEQD